MRGDMRQNARDLASKQLAGEADDALRVGELGDLVAGGQCGLPQAAGNARPHSLKVPILRRHPIAVADALPAVRKPEYLPRAANAGCSIWSVRGVRSGVVPSVTSITERYDDVTLHVTLRSDRGSAWSRAVIPCGVGAWRQRRAEVWPLGDA